MEGLKKLFETAKEAPGRHKLEVLSQTMEEVGELSTEIAIDTGFRINKEHSEDGIIGEAVDVMITVLDIIYLSREWSSYDEFKEEVNKQMNNKLGKWKKAFQK